MHGSRKLNTDAAKDVFDRKCDFCHYAPPASCTAALQISVSEYLVSVAVALSSASAYRSKKVSESSLISRGVSEGGPINLARTSIGAKSRNNRETKIANRSKSAISRCHDWRNLMILLLIVSFFFVYTIRR